MLREVLSNRGTARKREYSTTRNANLRRAWLSALLELRRPLMMAPTMCTSHVSCPSSSASARPFCPAAAPRHKSAIDNAPHD